MTDIPPRWYCVDRHGMTTLCADEDNARAEAAENDILWPRNAPHTAVQLAPVPAQHTADKSTWDRRDRIEFALRDAGFGEPEAAGITEAVESVLDRRAQGAGAAARFVDYFRHRCEGLFAHFGMESVDLYNAAVLERSVVAQPAEAEARADHSELFDSIRIAVESSAPRWGEEHDNPNLHKLTVREREWIASKVFSAVAAIFAARSAGGSNET